MNEQIKMEQLEILNKQQMALFFYLIPLGLSYLIIDHEKRKLNGEETYFTDEEIDGLTFLNRIISLILVIYFGYTIYLTYQLLKRYGLNTSSLTWQLVSSTLLIIAAIFSLISYLSAKTSFTQAEGGITL